MWPKVGLENRGELPHEVNSWRAYVSALVLRSLLQKEGCKITRNWEAERMVRAHSPPLLYVLFFFFFLKFSYFYF